MLNTLLGYFETNKSKLDKDWKQLKTLISEAIKQNDYEESFRLLKALGYIGYRYNFLEQFVDDKADSLVAELTQKIVKFPTQVEIKKNRVVFYDYFLLENRGFTQQYIDEIIRNDFELLFITLADERDYSEDNAIIKTLKNYPKAQIYIIPYKESKARQVELTIKTILDFAPSKLFVHNIPYDILPVCVALTLKQTGIKSYFLNISDHAFFLGKNAFDYFIDFRNYGHQLNALLRNIDLNRLLVIPTPPYLTPDKFTSFDGFPIDVTRKIVGFSGGMTYKIIDKKNTFLNLIKQVLIENDNFIFLFANVFGDDLLKKFIKDNHLEGRLVLIGNRRDINEVYKRIDIYVNTYPFSGGLMMQYAIEHNKPVLSFSDKQLLYVRMDKIFDKPLDEKFVITEEQKFVDIANKLIRDAEYRSNYANELAEGLNIAQKFQVSFAKLLNDTYYQEPVDMSNFEINTKAVADFHINMDNLFFKEYLYLKSAFFSNIKGAEKLLSLTIPVIALKVLGKLKKQRFGPTILRY